MAEERQLPVRRQFPFHPAPQPLQIPLPVDVVFEDQRAPVAVLEDPLHRARVTPKRRDDAFVDLAPFDRFVVVPESFHDPEVGIRGDELRKGAGGIIRLEVGDPIASVSGETRIAKGRERLGRVGGRCRREPVVADVKSAES